MTKKEQAEFDAKLDRLSEAATKASEAIGKKQRIGSLTLENHQFVACLVEALFVAIPGGRRAEYLGHLNEVFVYLGQAGRKLYVPEQPAEVKPE